MTGARLRFAVAVLVAAPLLGACGGAREGGQTAGMPELSTVQKGKLTACTDVPYEPFAFVEEGRFVGIDPDLVRTVATDLGLEGEVVDTDFDRIFQELEAGTCDVIASSLSITEERQSKYLFTDPYFEVNQSLLVREADSTRFGDLAAIPGKIGVQPGTTGADYAARQVGQDRLEEFNDASVMLQALRDNRIDGIVQDRPVSAHWDKSEEFELVTTFTDVTRETYGMALLQEKTELRDAINGALTRIREDGRYDEILSRYLGDAARR